MSSTALPNSIEFGAAVAWQKNGSGFKHRVILIQLCGGLEDLCRGLEDYFKMLGSTCNNS